MYHFCLCVHFLDSIGLHRVENGSHTEGAVSLHLYSPPFQTCQTFDQRTGHRNNVKMTFWSKYGERTPFVRDFLWSLIHTTSMKRNLFWFSIIYLLIFVSPNFAVGWVRLWMWEIKLSRCVILWQYAQYKKHF